MHPAYQRVLRLLQCGLLCVLSAAGSAAFAEQQRFVSERVYAFGDVHGAYDAMVGLLRALDVVDEDLNWQAGDSHLVSLGDLLDRGPDSRQAMDLLIRLQQQALAAGGRVHVLLGNHELMNLTGDLRYVSAGEYAAFATDASGAAVDGRPAGFAARQASFAPDGFYGRWLLQQPVALVINDTAYVHGGLPPLAATMTPEQLQDAVRGKLLELLTLRERLESLGLIAPNRDVLDSADRLQRRLDASTDEAQATPLPPEWRGQAERFIALARDPQFAHDGVMWYRGTARCHALLEEPVLAAALGHWGVSRVVVGHSPTSDHRVQQRFDGRAILADTGMFHEYYGGQASGLVLAGNGVEVLYPATGERAAAPDPASWLEFAGLDLDAVQNLLEHGELAADPVGPPGDQVARVVVSEGGRSVHALFSAARRAERRNAQAALAVDRLLGFELVAPLAIREYAGEKGVLSAVWPQVYTEAERQSNGWPGPQNWCGEGSLFDLLYLFDGLIQNRGRHLGTMIYEHRGHGFLSVGHGRAFGKSSALPEYLDAAPRRLSSAAAARLEALDLASLERVAGEWLSRAQLRGLLARRDEILDTWGRGG
jgi:hypothetical protein